MSQTHDPVAMVYHRRGCKKHTHSTRHGHRERNHWFKVYRCPVCGVTASHRRQPIICRGDNLKHWSDK
jgi:rubrerythrin